jgi:hypothetical protein
LIGREERESAIIWGTSLLWLLTTDKNRNKKFWI